MAVEEEEDVWERGVRLVSDLNSILEFDPYIDELGFVHPSQIESLHSLENFALDHEKPFFMKTRRKCEGQEESDDAEYAEDCSQRTEGHEVEAEPPGINPDQSYLTGAQGEAIDFPYDKSAFWCAQHKLAIAVPALAPIFEVAKKEFLANKKAYAKWLAGTRSSGTRSSPLSTQLSEVSLKNGQRNSNGHVGSETGGDGEASLQKNLMLYTRVLVVVNSDFASAWNARKRLLSRIEATEESLLAELRLAGMVLAYGPKSEESWAHRRWIINRMIAGGICLKTVESVLRGDSMLVEAIAGRSTMNYRAWRHRYWLVSRMTLQQASSELQESKKWAQSHVADNCCFHYRRCLLLGLLQAGLTSNAKIVSSLTLADSRDQANLSSVLSTNPEFLTILWTNELAWNKDLIERFIGREALWLHRRFLIWGFSRYPKIFKSTLLPVVSNIGGSRSSLSEEEGLSERAALLAERELQFADASIAACRPDPLDDAGRQQEYAAAYKVWVLWLHVGGKEDEKHEHPNGRLLELNDLELLLKDHQGNDPHQSAVETRTMDWGFRHCVFVQPTISQHQPTASSLLREDSPSGSWNEVEFLCVDGDAIVPTIVNPIPEFFLERSLTQILVQADGLNTEARLEIPVDHRGIVMDEHFSHVEALVEGGRCKPRIRDRLFWCGAYAQKAF